MKFFILFYLLLSFFTLHAQNTPKYSNEFLAIGVGGRGLAMSNTQSAIVDDATAGYWNPAGLLNIKKKYAFSLMHASYFAGIANYDYAGFATPVDSKSHIGVSLIRFAVDDIPDTRYLFDADGTLNYDNIKSFSAADYAFLFSYARRSLLIKGLRLGANFKVIYRNVGIFANAWGFGIDLGAQLTRNKWHFGITARDITGTYNTWYFNPETFYDVFTSTGNTIPENSIEITMPRLLTDAAFKTGIGNAFHILGTVGLDITFDGKRNTVIKTELFSADPHAGVEIDYKNAVFVRGGIGNFQQTKDFSNNYSYSFQPNFGVGIKIKNVGIDYAITDIGDNSESLYSNIFSVRVVMGKSKYATPRLQQDD
ncbi:MAG: hypothetical protein CMO01_28380 [Thalassobius sp.]|nr:hypothetical protein [Thalassovita sp.]|tara:strand:- start:281 stop:1381 length:1101 start_codon:yes stop_codon:yes gene_type:complete